MKTTIFNLIFILVITQFTFSQIQVFSGNVNSIISSSSKMSSVNVNNYSNDIVIRIDESLLSNNEKITIEGEISRNTGSIRIVGHQNHSISIVPFEKDNILYKKVIFHQGSLPEENKTRVESSNEYPKGNTKTLSLPIENTIIYPNPVGSDDNEITIGSSGKAEPTVLAYTLRNSYGAYILQEYFPDSDTIDVSKLTSGMYYIQIQTLQQVVTKQFIKN